MKKAFLCVIAVAAMLIPQSAAAQGDVYRQSQSRMLEPQQQVFVRPLVVDLRVTEKTRQKYVWEFPEVNVQRLTLEDITNYKVIALYNSVQAAEADVMVAPTFDIRTLKKGIQITVIGYPAVYENWQIAKDEKDYKWIEDVYGVDIRTVDHTQSIRIGENRVRTYDEK